MKLRDQVAIALDELNAHRLRAFLTSLGVIMGVGSVLAMISVGDGAKAEARRQIELMGSNQIFVRYRDPEEGDKINRALSKGLTPEDAAAITSLPGVVAVSPEGRGWGNMRFEDYTFEGNCVLVEPGYARVRNRKVSRGRFITSYDVETAAKVCVLRKEAPRDKRRWWYRLDPVGKIFKRGDPLGKMLLIQGVPYKVIGVIEEERPSEKQLVNVYWGGWREVVFIPFTSYVARNDTYARAHGINVKVASSDAVEGVVTDISQLLLHRHGGIKDFTIDTMKERLSDTFKILNMYNMVFGLLAGVGLIVGGIGIMNIMMASLNERIREIGLRKSLGAMNRDILFQFLMEAVLLSALGGLFGLMLGAGASSTVAHFTGWTTVIRPQAVAIAFVYSVVIGVVFGLYPARRAARLDPIECLRAL